MKKLLSLFCITNLLLCSKPSISVQAVEIEEPYTETVVPASEGLISNYSLWASNYNGSLCVSSVMRTSSTMEEIGIKNLTVQYSYDNSNWYDEWNAGNFLDYGTNTYTLSNYIIALDRSECYYRVTCTHYAKKSIFNTQSDSNTSNSVWIS